jgi:hypothetical protein
MDCTQYKFSSLYKIIDFQGILDNKFEDNKPVIDGNYGS